MINHYYMADFSIMKLPKIPKLEISNPLKYKQLVDAENAKNISRQGILKQNQNRALTQAVERSKIEKRAFADRQKNSARARLNRIKIQMQNRQLKRTTGNVPIMGRILPDNWMPQKRINTATLPRQLFTPKVATPSKILTRRELN
jgi:hypothetical protein